MSRSDDADDLGTRSVGAFDLPDDVETREDDDGEERVVAVPESLDLDEVSENQVRIIQRKVLHPDATHADIADMVGVDDSWVSRTLSNHYDEDATLSTAPTAASRGRDHQHHDAGVETDADPDPEGSPRSGAIDDIREEAMSILRESGRVLEEVDSETAAGRYAAAKRILDVVDEAEEVSE